MDEAFLFENPQPFQKSFAAGFLKMSFCRVASDACRRRNFGLSVTQARRLTAHADATGGRGRAQTCRLRASHRVTEPCWPL